MRADSFKLMIFILAFLATSLFASEDLLKVSIKAESESNIKVTVTNVSNHSLKVLKWNTIFEKEISANLFIVKSGVKKIPYKGKMVKRANPSEGDYIIFKPKEAKSAYVDLSRYYKLEESGEYSVSYRGNFQFSIIKNSRSLKVDDDFSIYPTIKKPVKFFFRPRAYKMAMQKEFINFEKCTLSQQEDIKLAHKEAIKISKIALDALNNMPLPTTAPRYKIWFGKEDEARQKIIKTNFNNIYNALNEKDTKFSCTCNEDSYAYVYSDEPYNIYLCKSFFSASTRGINTKAGTLIHEVSHFNVVANTEDEKYGPTDTKRLARNRPYKALQNADNYEYFAENYPVLSIDEQGEAISPYKNGERIDLQAGVEYSKEGNFTLKELSYYKIEPPLSFSMLEIWSEGASDTVGKFYDKDVNLIDENDDDANYNFKIMQLINDKTRYLTFKEYDLKAVSYHLKIKNYVPDTIQVSLDENVEKKALNDTFSEEKTYILYQIDVPKDGYVKIIGKGEKNVKGFLYDDKLNLLSNYNVIDGNIKFKFKRKYTKGRYFLLVRPHGKERGSFKLSTKYEPIKEIQTPKKVINPAIITYLLN